MAALLLGEDDGDALQPARADLAARGKKERTTGFAIVSQSRRQSRQRHFGCLK